MDIYMSSTSQEVYVAFKAGALINIVINYHHKYISYSVTAECDERAECIEFVRTDWNGNILPPKERAKDGK